MEALGFANTAWTFCEPQLTKYPLITRVNSAKEIFTTPVFIEWFKSLKDERAKARIQARIDRMELGNLGDVKSVGHGVEEARIFYGPGYRLYFVRRSDVVVILLCGGDKGSQVKDIEKAKRLVREIEG